MQFMPKHPPFYNFHAYPLSQEYFKVAVAFFSASNGGNVDGSERALLGHSSILQSTNPLHENVFDQIINCN